MKRSEKLKQIFHTWKNEYELTNGHYEYFTEESMFSKGETAYCTLGLAGEVGECLEEFKKYVRDGGDPTKPIPNDHERYSKFIDELGDVLWYVTRLARYHGRTLDDLMYDNMNKLIKKIESKENADR